VTSACGHRLVITLLAVLSVCAAGASEAPSPGERYIPIGQSPGLSGDETIIGRIRQVQEESYVLVVQDDDGERQSVRVTPTTLLWLDRSKRRRATLDAAFEDCRRGRRVEIKLREGSQDAEWVKIEP
jgi:hypothetical protein